MDQDGLNYSFFPKFPGLRHIEITETISFSECINYLQIHYDHLKPKKFNGNIKHIQAPTFSTIMNAKERCDIPSNIHKIHHYYDHKSIRACMADYIRLYVKWVTLCCCEGPSIIFCIKHCKDKSLPCCKLCSVDEEEFDNYSDSETESSYEASSDVNTFITSESE